MIDLILTILCSTSIAIILKVNSNKNGDSITLLAGNYFIAWVISLILYVTNNSSTASIDLIPLGLFLSLLFVGSIFAFSKSVNLSGAALSTVSSRLSVFVPITLSIIFYSELPSMAQIFGLILTLVTIFFFYLSISRKSQSKTKNNKFLYLLYILIGIGIADFFMKVFQENWNSTDKPFFLFWIFFFSFLLTITIMIKRKKRPNKNTLILGMVMGVPNVFSSYFLIESLKSFPAIFVYPTVNISIILVTAFLVKLIWKEFWNNYALFALISGVLSIVMLSI